MVEFKKAFMLLLLHLLLLEIVDHEFGSIGVGLFTAERKKLQFVVVFIAVVVELTCRKLGHFQFSNRL